MYFVNVFKKSIFRPKDYFELGILNFLCFLLLILMVYVEKYSADSDVLMRYTKFLVEHSLLIGIAFSLAVAGFHYKLISKAKSEIKCRILVGDRVFMLKMRYVFMSLFMMTFPLFFSCIISITLGYSYSNILYLAPVLIFYPIIGALMVR